MGIVRLHGRKNVEERAGADDAALEAERAEREFRESLRRRVAWQADAAARTRAGLPLPVEEPAGPLEVPPQPALRTDGASTSSTSSARSATAAGPSASSPTSGGT